MKKIMIIEAPSNLGLIEPYPGGEPGVGKLPAWLKTHGLYDYLGVREIVQIHPPKYSMTVDAESRVRNAESIVCFSRQLSVAVCSAFTSGYFPVVIGGDCSILIGCALALKSMGTFGLFFLDGHTDFMWPELSQTAGAAGMELAMVCGYGSSKLTDIDSRKPYIEEKHVWCVGNREFTTWYVEAIQSTGIHYVDLNQLRKTGIRNCVCEFLTYTDKNRLDGFWIHLDVDVLDDALMPAVDSRQPGGLWYDELGEILFPLLSHPKAAGMNITILDPDRDPSGRYTRMFVNYFCRLRKVLQS
ncbi:arginase [Thermoflavifilum aggregans]|uniref:Arginase n=2 Tax=Thermoflavifilum aggregans TaxID=454188 RepID=A0A2M9CXD9_9BACT|nr:arginase [Thermoflavifilum aggregans]